MPSVNCPIWSAYLSVLVWTVSYTFRQFKGFILGQQNVRTVIFVIFVSYVSPSPRRINTRWRINRYLSISLLNFTFCPTFWCLDILLPLWTKKVISWKYYHGWWGLSLLRCQSRFRLHLSVSSQAQEFQRYYLKYSGVKKCLISLIREMEIKATRYQLHFWLLSDEK